MPTTQPESTFIGGLGSQQTTQQIELGVLKDTAIVSLSTSPAPKLNITALSLSKTTTLLAVSPNHQMLDNGLSPRFHLKIVKHINSKYRGVIEEETELSQFKQGTAPSLHECWAWGLLMHFATVRFFEIWGKGKIADVYRGLAGKTHNFQSSISGMIGGTLYNDSRAVDKDANGRFFPRAWEKIYPKIPRWPAKGIDSAKTLARLMHNNNSIK